MSATCSAQDRAALAQLEEELWREDSRFDRVLMDQRLADDFVEIGRSGRMHSRSDVLAVPRAPIGATLPLEHYALRMISDDTALATYTSETRANEAVTRAQRSSIWSRRGASWVLRFHQGTPI